MTYTSPEGTRIDSGGKKLGYFMHNEYMPFFMNSLVDTVVGWFSEIKHYRKLSFFCCCCLEPYWPQSTGRIQKRDYNPQFSRWSLRQWTICAGGNQKRVPGFGLSSAAVSLLIRKHVTLNGVFVFSTLLEFNLAWTGNQTTIRSDNVTRRSAGAWGCNTTTKL